MANLFTDLITFQSDEKMLVTLEIQFSFWPIGYHSLSWIAYVCTYLRTHVGWPKKRNICGLWRHVIKCMNGGQWPSKMGLECFAETQSCCCCIACLHCVYFSTACMTCIKLGILWQGKQRRYWVFEVGPRFVANNWSCVQNNKRKEIKKKKKKKNDFKIFTSNHYNLELFFCKPIN